MRESERTANEQMADFAARIHEKCLLYRTAWLRTDIPHVPLGFEPGQYVSVRFFCMAYNALKGKREPVYSISNTTEHTRNSPTVYESALERFCL